MREETIGVDESSLAILWPLMFLSLVLNFMLLIGFSYLWSTRKQDRDDLTKLSAEVRVLTKDFKQFGVASLDSSSTKKVDKVPDAEPFGISVDKSNDKLVEQSAGKEDGKPVDREKETPPPPTENSNARPWVSFLEDYNHIAASMAVPGQLRACENFVAENSLKILAYIGNMQFIPSATVKDSRFWAWQIEGSAKYAVVPNPMIPYDEDLHSHEGMKETFASNYESGKYTKYIVDLPAILIYSNKNDWKISEPGVMKLERYNEKDFSNINNFSFSYDDFFRLCRDS